MALAEKGKEKSKKGSSTGLTSKGEKKCDMRKVKCFACHKTSRYSNQCPNKKKGKKKSLTTASMEIDEFSSRFDEDISLIVCLSRSRTQDTGVWYIDSGSSYYMT